MQQNNNINKNLSRYCEDVGKTPLLSREEEIRLATAKDKAEGEKEREEAKEALIKANLRLVIKLAKSYENLGLDLLDLISEGNIGLVRAVDKYDVNNGAKFSTYASWWIRQGIMKGLTETSRTVRLPTYLVQKARLIAKYIETYRSKNKDESPSKEQISESLDVPLVTVERITGAKQNMVYLDAGLDGKVRTYAGQSAASKIEDKTVNSPLLDAITTDDSDNIQGLLDTLTPKEKVVIKGRFGFGGGKADTLDTVGKKLGLTRERVRQIEMLAMRKLRFRYKSKYGEVLT